LDQHKVGHPQKKIRKRAQEIIASFYPKLSGEESDVIRNGVRLEFIAEDPIIDFIKYRLRSEITDDWLIASVIEFKQKNPNDEVKIVSADLGLSIKAKTQNFKVLRPSETDKLAEESDEGEKRIKDLRSEFAKSCERASFRCN
jgi:predicted ribonuclease YlaK